MTQPLTAHLCARAIVASARAYGADPLRAVTTPRGLLRRSLSPAAAALAAASGRPLAAACRLLGVNVQSVITARRKASEGFTLALTRALEELGEPQPASPRVRPIAPMRSEAAELPVVDPPPRALAPPAVPGPLESQAAAATPSAKPAAKQTHAERLAMIREAARKRGLLRARPTLIRSRTRSEDYDDAEVRDLTETFR